MGVAPGRRRVLLLTALALIVVSAALFLFLGYASEHRYDEGFDWVSSRVLQPMAWVMVFALLVGLGLAVAALVARNGA